MQGSIRLFQVIPWLQLVMVTMVMVTMVMHMQDSIRLLVRRAEQPLLSEICSRRGSI